MGNPDVLIITVNFRQDQCTQRFLKSAAQLDGFNRCHLLIVDNSADADSAFSTQDGATRRNNVERLALPNNAGYFGAARWALHHYLAQHSLPRWVVVCNNDVIFNDPRFLLRLITTDPSTAGVIAPSIISGITGHDENPSIRVRPSPFRMWRYRFWFSSFYLMWFKQWVSPSVRKIRHRIRNWLNGRDASHLREIYAASGAFFIFTRRFFEAGGFIDDGAFLYAEEFRVAEMCRQLQLRVVHDPELKVWHAGSQSTGRMLTRSVYLHQKAGFRYALTRYARSYPELQPRTPSVAIGVPNIAPSAAGESAG